MNDDGTAGHLLSNTPNVIMKAIMRYDFTGIMCHNFRFSTSISRMRRTFLNSIFMNMVENNIMVTTQPKIINTEVVSRLIHDITPILQTLNPANSQIIPAIKESDLVFISLCYEALIYVCKGTNKVLSLRIFVNNPFVINH